MELSELDRQQLIEDIINDFGGKLDGQRRNIIMDCPFCGKKEKFGIYVGPEKSSKHFGMANCFRCGRSFDSLEKTLTALEREEWIPKQVTELGGEDDELIAYISQFFTLKTGDLLYTGTPVGVGPVHINDHLEGWLEERKVLEFNCK